MNLRQKCKKQKQYIEQLERMALPVKKIIYTPESGSLTHLRLKRKVVIDWGMPMDDRERFKELTINQICYDMGLSLGDYVEFNDKGDTATLDIWVKRKEENNE